MGPARRTWLRRTAGWLALGASAGLLGCGFRLRQAPSFAFRTLVAPLPDGSSLRRELRAALVAAGIQVLDTLPVTPSVPRPVGDTGGAPVAAANHPPAPSVDAVLEVLTDQREKSVVGSTAAGQVREFQLRIRFRFRLSTPRGKLLIPDTELLLQRDISYSESIALSKADEEAELYRDMQTDIVQQVLRRLAAVREL
jgi:LPS-assembly lipoprotein